MGWGLGDERGTTVRLAWWLLLGPGWGRRDDGGREEGVREGE